MIDQNTQQPLNNTLQNTPEKTGAASNIWEIFKFFLLALIIVAPIRLFIAQPFIVQGASMDPTFATNQYLIVDEISYQLHKPQRGDVVVLRYPKDPSKFFIKRIIGLPGETLTIKNGVVSITEPDTNKTFVLDEPYVFYTKTDRADDETITLRKNKDNSSNDEYYVMGDNRAASLDSRAWGTLPERMIVGRAMIRLFPFAKIGFSPGQSYHYTENDSVVPVQ